MKLKRSFLLGATALSLGLVATSAPKPAKAYSTYQTIPRSIRGYYIGNRYMAKITGRQLSEGGPQADMYTYKVLHVNRSGHNYRIHTSFTLGNTVYYTLHIRHVSKNKLKFGGMPLLHKVSKSHYYWYANHGITG